MKFNFIVAFVVFTLFSSFISHKDLNEYGRWLKYYQLKDEDFKERGPVGVQLHWEVYKPGTIDFENIYNRLYIKFDQNLYVDLYSYRIIINKGKQGKITYRWADPETKVQVIRKQDRKAATILFSGTSDIIETALWRNEQILEVYGFTEVSGKWKPVIRKFNLRDNTLVTSINDHGISPTKINYITKVVLKGITEGASR